MTRMRLVNQFGSRAVLLGVLLLAACTTAQPPTLLPTPPPLAVTALPTVPPTADPALSQGGAQAEPTTTGPEQIVRRAVTLTASTLGVPESQVQVSGSPIPIEWADASLGCPQPGEAYSQQATPGYLISLTVDGAPYQVHTDRTTRVVLCLDEGQAVDAEQVRDPIVAEFIQQARGRLAADLGISQDQVVLVRSQGVDWSSSALGCAAGPETPVTTVVTPGYRIELAVGPERYFFHTDQMRMIRCDDPIE